MLSLAQFDNLDVQQHLNEHPALFGFVRDVMAAPDKQYLMVSDIDHIEPAEQEFLKSPALAALLHYAAIPHVAFEITRETAPPELLTKYREQLKNTRDRELADKLLWKQVLLNEWAMATAYSNLSSRHFHELNEKLKKIAQDFEEKRINHEEFGERTYALLTNSINYVKRYSESKIAGFSRAGLRVTLADSRQWLHFLINTLAERTFLGDREVAAYIEQQAGNEKTAVIYGAGHIWYGDTLATRLGVEKTVRMDIYADRQSYAQRLRKWNVSADILPDRVYFLKERTLELPDLALYRRADKRTGGQQQQWRDDIRKLFGPDANPAEKAAAISEIQKLPGIDAQYYNFVPAGPS